MKMIAEKHERREIYQNILAYNKNIPLQYLKALPFDELICFMHPTDKRLLLTKLKN